jgi:hypothetical protein
MTTITMTRPQYDALLAAAKVGDPVAAAQLQKLIDAGNGIIRYLLQIRWQDVGGKPPPRIELGKGWPPDQTFLLQLERRISRADVDDVLRTNASNPVSVMVTPDPLGVVGWTLIDDYDFQAGA